MFKQAKQNRVFQDIVNQIQEAILNGDLNTGDKLPCERKLKEVFKTSRGTLREALRVLEQKGLIEIKTGMNGGAIVKDVTTHNVSETLDLLIRSQKVSLKDLAQFREDVEGIVTGLSAKRAAKEDIDKLRAILQKEKIIVDAGISKWNEFIDIDNEFHMTLVEIAGNPIYESILRTVHDNINRYYNDFLSKEEKIMKNNYRDMCNIVDAVEKGNAKKAQSLARDHVKLFNKYMEEKEKSE
jgi:DNA-binding FadR family transcriptional regulator